MHRQHRSTRNPLPIQSAPARDDELDARESAIATRESRSAVLQASVGTLEVKLRGMRREFRDLQSSVEDRRRYHSEQEVLIKQTVDAGNEALHDIETAIAYAKEELRLLKIELRTRREDKKLLEEDIEKALEQARALNMV